MEKRYKHAVVIGKFMPLHKGHMHMIEQAALNSNVVTVLVCSLQSEPIPGILRFSWMKQEFPLLDVRHIWADLPQYPEEHEDFWSIWCKVIRDNTSEDLDVIFSSEDYGDTLGDKLNISSVIVDKSRTHVPISGTKIRNDVYKNFKYLSDAAKPYHVRKVVILGPESCGKTTLAQRLSEEINCPWVPEYGREYVDNFEQKYLSQNQEFSTLDISHIAAGQMLAEEKAAKNSNSLIICDTDLITTQIWSEIYLGYCPDWIINESMNRKYDLYLVCPPNIPWVDDGTREMSDRRIWHYNRILEELSKRKIDYEVVVPSDLEERVKYSLQSIKFYEKHI